MYENEAPNESRARLTTKQRIGTTAVAMALLAGSATAVIVNNLSSSSISHDHLSTPTSSPSPSETAPTVVGGDDRNMVVPAPTPSQ